MLLTHLLVLYLLLKDIERLVPFEEDEKDPTVWFLDHTYIDDMNSMFKKINGPICR